MLLFATISPHSVLDIVIDDEIEFLVGEAVVSSQHRVDLVENCLGSLREKLLHFNDASRLSAHLGFIFPEFPGGRQSRARFG